MTRHLITFSHKTQPRSASAKLGLLHSRSHYSIHPICLNPYVNTWSISSIGILAFPTPCGGLFMARLYRFCPIMTECGFRSLILTDYQQTNVKLPFISFCLQHVRHAVIQRSQLITSFGTETRTYSSNMDVGAASLSQPNTYSSCYVPSYLTWCEFLARESGTPLLFFPSFPMRLPSSYAHITINLQLDGAIFSGEGCLYIGVTSPNSIYQAKAFP